MKKFFLYILALFLSINIGLEAKASVQDNEDYEVTMKQDILCLMMAYPEYITGVDKKDDGNVYIIMKSGKRILYDDKKEKSFAEKEANADLQDMLEEPYPLTAITKLMDKDKDPGRFRVYSLLNEVYGESRAQVEKNLKRVNGGKVLQFNGNNQASDCLQRAINEVIATSKNSKNIGGNVFPINGTFNYRQISGTGRLSPHAFGIAIDLKSDKRDYWKWASQEQGQKRLEAYPKELVEIFEKNNFIWGGKWSHFDILHFEYRPEIILKARYFGNMNKNKEVWYDGVPTEYEKIKEYIKQIEAIL